MRSGTSSACSGVAARISFRCAGLYEFSLVPVFIHCWCVFVCKPGCTSRPGRPPASSRCPLQKGVLSMRSGLPRQILPPSGESRRASNQSAPVPRSSESGHNGSPRARAMQRAHGTTPLSGAVNAQRYPPRHVLARRRGGRWLPIAGLRACAAASQVRAYTFAERRFSPALHGLGVTGHEGRESCQIRQAARLQVQSALRQVKHTFAALPPTSPTVSPTGRAHFICWGDHLLCCGHLVASVLQSL